MMVSLALKASLQCNLNTFQNVPAATHFVHFFEGVYFPFLYFNIYTGMSNLAKLV